MANSKKTERVCVNGHRYYKSSDCPTCPECEAERKPNNGFLALLYAPARRALEREKIDTLQKLSQFTEEEILSLHGMGKSTLPVLKSELKKTGLAFKKEDK